MKKTIAFVLVLLLAVPLAYCADKRYVPGYPRTTSDDKNQTVLAPSDYTVIVPAAHGESKGFLLLGFIPFWIATQSQAMDDLYKKIDVKGKTTSLANVYRVKDHHYFILFTLQTCDITADVIELKAK